MILSNLDHLVKDDFPHLADAIHPGPWYVHQIIEEKSHEQWCYECLLGPATSPAAILQFMPHGGDPQVQYFLTEGGNFDQPELTEAQIKSAQAYIDSVDPGHPRLKEEEKRNAAQAPKPASGETKGGCMAVLILPLILGGTLLGKCFGWL